MEVGQVLHMNAGTGETSYSNNSHLQKKVISMTMPIIEEAMTNLYSSTSPSSLVIADLGCSSGHNSLFVVSELIKIVEKLRQKSGHQSPEIQVLLNDLPGNDFNTIFKSLPSFQKNLSSQLESKDAGPYFFSGVPGSFYESLLVSHFGDGIIEKVFSRGENRPIWRGFWAKSMPSNASFLGEKTGRNRSMGRRNIGRLDTGSSLAVHGRFIGELRLRE
ncbi:hypothetical protein F2P56_019052 [Juglans regia]|uniref:Salicylate carboxymethyltransferase-like n=1 Tax=Juglans regia TaxID=51240 RepID=A0A833XAZ9_JUGRE|nr:hypothetical protein F2P56_019052 [Juglans regia]